jgi:hypothetical protein
VSWGCHREDCVGTVKKLTRVGIKTAIRSFQCRKHKIKKYYIMNIRIKTE